MSVLVWFRADLRIDDNTALYNALLQREPVHALYYATPAQWQQHDMAPVKAEFIWRNLDCLRKKLASIGIPLSVQVVPGFADIEKNLLAFCRANNCTQVFANREYAINELRRDENIAAQLAKKNIAWHCYDDAILLPPHSVKTQQGLPYKVFTPFKRALIDLIEGSALQCFGISQLPQADAIEPPQLPVFPYANSSINAALWPAGEDAAAARLGQFIETHIDNYHSERDIPALNGTSQLSPYLALGVISIRRCVEAALAVNTGQWRSGNTGVITWLNELLWREFYLHVLAQFPRVSMNRPLRVETERVAWRHCENDFQAWCEGRTGFPLVDAAMRQLAQTGWMHNRLRMVSAMFLSKYLLLDWRRGEQFFMRHLIDGDLAANNGGWQWCASTGTDAVPYFRLLSPVRQLERFDPDAQFCKSYLPELAAVDARYFRQPGHAELVRAGYPLPIVDLKAARERVLLAFSS